MNTWQSQFQDSLKTKNDFEQFFESNFDEISYPSFIPKVFAHEIKAKGKDSALWKQFLPHIDEDSKSIQENSLFDPIGDRDKLQASQIIHRYSNRALFLPTKVCPIICRYCFRKNEISNSNEEIFKSDFNESINYLNKHKEINEIIFSGGDPLILSDEKLDFYLSSFSKIEHIKYIRFHTRTPIILPSRITDSFLDLIKKYSQKFNQVQIVIHANHLDEFNNSNEHAIKILAKNNISLLSQSVFLKDVNNDIESISNLIEKFMELKIRPYYIHHPDNVKGGKHFSISLEEGRRIYSKLRNITPGWALPQYIIDIPTGEGKTSAFNPESFEFSGNLINKNSQIIKI